ncbi:unnamed protein product [Linum trigynum]|uniref:EF-hand domain-containing protein n=1 Tax=Linum trigynum TaxID=586398 RepID=A0AAV2CFB4_9ROSI
MAEAASLVDTSSPIAKQTSSPSSTAAYLQKTDELQKVFEKFDSNGDDKISLSALVDVLRSMGTNSSPPDLHSAAHSGAPQRPPSSARPSICTTRTRTGSAPGPSSTTCSMEEWFRMIKGVDSDSDKCVNFQELEKMMANANSVAAAVVN